MVDENLEAVADYFCRSFDTAGEARATAWNFYNDDREKMIIEIRKITSVSGNGNVVVQKAGGDCWYGVTLGVEVIDTYHMG